jgi:hypothetical protein
MFGQLPNLFERNFIIGYFLPVVAFLIGTLVLATTFEYFPPPVLATLLPLDQTEVLIGTTLFVLMSVFGAVVLLSLNQEVMGLMEGAGRYNPARIFLPYQRHGYRELQSRVHDKTDYISRSAENPDYSAELSGARRERAHLMWKLTTQYPDSGDQLLPTYFGNIIRAFEAYPRRMYGLESSQGGWNRLQGVIPNEYRAIIDSAKANTDLWLNLWFLSFAVLVEYVLVTLSAVFVLDTAEPKLAWIMPLLALLLIIYSANVRARHAAAEWGDLVKSSFDLFLPDLRKQLGLRTPPTMEEERRLWNTFSRALIYADPYSVDELTQFRVVEDSPGKAEDLSK